jgi:hypothetical protein
MLELTGLFIVSSIMTILIGLVLFYASVEDLRNRTIRAIWVIVLYIIMSVRAVVSNSLGMESTYVFLFAFTLFMLLALISRGQFGYGDALVLGALGWYYHTFNDLQTFLFAIGVIGVPWAIYWSWHYGKKEGYRNIINAFKRTIDINDAKVGMVLAKDRFMNGLTGHDIENLKAEGHMTIDVKQPFPFIPVVFIAFIVTLFV